MRIDHLINGKSVNKLSREEVYARVTSWSTIGSAVNTSYADFSVTPGTGYYYAVRAYDAAGNKSPTSSPLFLNTPLSAGNSTTTSDTSPPTPPSPKSKASETTPRMSPSG